MAIKRCYQLYMLLELENVLKISHLPLDGDGAGAEQRLVNLQTLQSFFYNPPSINPFFRKFKIDFIDHLFIES